MNQWKIYYFYNKIVYIMVNYLNRNNICFIDIKSVVIVIWNK